MFRSHTLKQLSLLALLCLVPQPAVADELQITSAQVIKTNSSLGPHAKTTISDVALSQLPPEASEQLLKASWVNGVLLEEYARAVKDNDLERLRDIHQAKSRDIPIPTGGGNTQLSFLLSDGTRLEFGNLWDWEFSGYLQSKFWGLFWDKASSTEMPGTIRDFPLISPPAPPK